MLTQGLRGEEWWEQGAVTVHSSQGHPLLSDPPLNARGGGAELFVISPPKLGSEAPRCQHVGAGQEEGAEDQQGGACHTKAKGPQTASRGGREGGGAKAGGRHCRPAPRALPRPGPCAPS